MKKRLIIASVLASVLLFVAGTWLDGRAKSDKLKYETEMKAWSEKRDLLLSAPGKISEIDKKIASGSATAEDIRSALMRFPELASQLGYRSAEMLYAECEKHLFNFLYFRKNNRAEEAGKERDEASKLCKSAYDKMNVQGRSGNNNERFHTFYAIGNISVRKAILAVSKDEQTLALQDAINAYIAALHIRDDYQTKFNLELLLSISQNSGNSGDSSPATIL